MLRAMSFMISGVSKWHNWAVKRCFDIFKHRKFSEKTWNQCRTPLNNPQWSRCAPTRGSVTPKYFHPADSASSPTRFTFCSSDRWFIFFKQIIHRRTDEESSSFTSWFIFPTMGLVNPEHGARKFVLTSWESDLYFLRMLRMSVSRNMTKQRFQDSVVNTSWKRFLECHGNTIWSQGVPN